MLHMCLLMMHSFIFTILSTCSSEGVGILPNAHCPHSVPSGRCLILPPRSMPATEQVAALLRATPQAAGHSFKVLSVAAPGRCQHRMAEVCLTLQGGGGGGDALYRAVLLVMHL